MLLHPDLSSRSGQNKPWGSIPRINWGHPITRGLQFYGYDTGTGDIVDLVTGIVAAPTGTTPPSNKSSPFGSGLTYTQTGGSRVFPIMPKINTSLLSSLYSAACGWFISALPSAGGTFCSPFGIGDGTAGQDCTLHWANTGTTDLNWALNSTEGTLWTANSVNVFHTSVVTNTGPTAQSVYYDGKLQLTQALTASKSTSISQVVFNQDAPASLNLTGVNGKVYFGAFWNRTLMPRDAFLLHFDPYSFLIYPEDEMFVAVVGAAALARQKEIMINQAMKRASYW